MAYLDLEQAVAGRVVGAAADVSTFGGGAGAILWGLSGQDIAAMLGAVAAILGVIVSIWHKIAMQRIARDRLNWEMGKD